MRNLLAVRLRTRDLYLRYVNIKKATFVKNLYATEICCADPRAEVC